MLENGHQTYGPRDRETRLDIFQLWVCSIAVMNIPQIINQLFSKIPFYTIDASNSCDFQVGRYQEGYGEYLVTHQYNINVTWLGGHLK